jgi:acetyl-CoA carboxylase biotin carboxyl carrier protein
LKLRIRKTSTGYAPLVAPALTSLPPAPAPGTSPGPGAASSVPPLASAPSPIDEPALDLAVVKSPIVGTFYRSPEPGAPSFVEVGDRVKKDQVLCIIEAMKLMNEITSEYEGELTSAYVENGKPVQYGERLFAIKTS